MQDGPGLQGRGPGRGLMAVAALMLLSACESIPDAVNPMTWGDALFGSDGAEPSVTAEAPVPASSSAARPNAPEKKAPSGESEAGAKPAEALPADEANAAYAESGEADLRAPAGADPKPDSETSGLVPDSAPDSAPDLAPDLAEAPPPIDGLPVNPGSGLDRASGPEVPAVPTPETSANSLAAPSLPAAADRAPAPVAGQDGVPASEPAVSGSGQLAALPGYVPRPTRSAQVGVINFASGSAGLSGRDLALIADVAAMYKRTGGYVRVIGHASSHTRDMDPMKRKIVNFEVSLRRAEAVAQQLIRRGVPKERVLVSAQSDSESIYYEYMPSGEAGNRRAEIYLDY